MNVETHKCPNCGGPLLFDPKTQRFHCEYCFSSFTESEVTAFEQKMAENPQISDQQQSEKTAEGQDSRPEEASAPKMDVFLCPSCGAQIVTDATTAATYCYYCHNPVVLSGRLQGDFLPDAVLPFAVEKEKAVDKFLAWSKKKWFIPKDFFSKNQIEKMTGVYFPYWLVDAQIEGEMDAKGNVLRVWRIGEIEYTETKQFAIHRKGKLNFSDLIKTALSKNITQKMVTAVQPFPLDKAVPFRSQYLSGFQAEKRDIEIENLKENIEGDLKQYSKSLLKDSANGFTVITSENYRFNIEEQKNRYVLLPVWLLTYRNKRKNDKVYYYAMNGQTGKVSGILHLNKIKLALTAASLFTVLLLGLLAGGYFL